MDKTLFMIKPGNELLIPLIVKMVEGRGLAVEFWRRGQLSLAAARELYQDHLENNWFFPLISYISSGVVHIFRVEGPGAFRLVKEVKEEVRENFRWGRFQSVMHCPNDFFELQWNIEALEKFFVARLELQD